MIDLFICIFWIVLFMLIAQAFFATVGLVIGAIWIVIETIINVFKKILE